MEVGTEISQKIRSAIKAKLMEFGAYVDDELPEYIMVMVANKRSRVQMNNDLCLFLGTHTSAFTEWLHGLLGKLQTIRGDHDKSTDKQGIAEKLKTKKGKGKMQSGKKDGTEKSQRKNKCNNDSSNSVTKGKDASDVRSLGHEETLHAIVNVEENCHKQMIENVELAENNSMDSLAEKESPVILKNSHGDVEDVRQFLITEASGDGISTEFETSETELATSRPMLSMSSISTKPAVISLKLERRSPSPEEHVQSSATTRKRKASTSASADSGKEGDETEVYDPAVSNIFTCKSIIQSSTLQTKRETDITASDGGMHDLQAEPQDQYGPTPQKVIRLADAVQLDDIKQALAEVLEKAQTCNDEISHFSKMVESSLRKLSRQNLSLAKLQIQQVLFRLESTAAQKSLARKNQNQNSVQPVSYPGEDSKCNSVGSYLDASEISPGHENTNSSSVDVPKNRRATSSQHPSHMSPPVEEESEDYENKIKSLSDSDKLIGSVRSPGQKMSSDNDKSHVALNSDCLHSDTRANLEANESHIERIIFHPRSSKNLKKSSLANETTDCHQKIYDSTVKSGERDSTFMKSKKGPQSPVSLSKADVGSPSSVHSCPLGSTSGQIIKRSVTSISRESTLSPVNLHSKSGAPHILKSKLASTKSKLSPSILVNSIHTRKRLEPSESASVLRQRDRSPRTADSSKLDIQDSPRQYAPETLKVMAKNLKITVINKRAVASEQESSSEDSDEDESSDEGDEDGEENDDITKKTEDEAAPTKDTLGHCPS